VYCWRGGKRSGSLALILDQIGFRVHLIEGGYKAFRTAVLAGIAPLVERLTFRVVCGPTGSGKTRLLQSLQARGAQVLDLEDLANHRSSVLGLVPGQQQPSQKQFDTRVWDALRHFDPARPVYVESESKKVGNVSVPDALILAMRASACLNLKLDDEERGREVVQGWQERVRAGRTPEVVRELLVQHYDPMYAVSIQRNFKQWGQALPVRARDRSPAAMDELAQTLLA
jgi:tRNA 2-selenouridine synthase